MKIDGKTIAAEILDRLKPQVAELKRKGINPTLGIVIIGKDPSSHSFVKQKKLKADEIGAVVKIFQYDSVTEEELFKIIDKLNNDLSIHGIIVQRPLPENIDKNKISNLVDVKKDVDGFNPNSSFDAPVAEAVLEILKRIGEGDLSSKKITVIGKGETAGGQVIKLLKKQGLEPQIIDSQSTNPETLIKSADIIISAVGKEKIINPQILNKNQILIGLGLFSKEGKLKGDYDENEVEGKVKYFTPTLGGVGPVNVAFLMSNLVKASFLFSRA